MARHRNVRTMKYEEEFFDEDDVEDCYGQSFDDKYCISPGTAAQFTFSRGSNFDLGSYISGDSSPAIPSQVPEIITPKSQPAKVTNKFNDFDEACLNSCLDKVHEIIANLYPHQMVVDCIKKHNFNTEAVLNDLLSSPDAPKPQRQPRQGRRAQEFPLDLYAQSDTSTSEYVDDYYNDDDDDNGRDISKCTLVMTVSHYKRQKYNSVGEEECSSYSSLNSGDTEDQQVFLSEQNGDSLGHNQMQIMPRLESVSMSSENLAPSTESSDDDNDLEVDGEHQSVDDDNDCIESEKMSCRFEDPLTNNSCNDMTLNSTSSDFPTLKSDKQGLLKLFAMANINKQKMEESANLTSANTKDFSASPKPSLCEEISRSPLLQNQINSKPNYGKCSSSAKENSCQLFPPDIFQQRHSSSSSSNDYDLSCITTKCGECSANQVKKNSNKTSLADLTRQRFGSNLKEPIPKVVGSCLSQISSFCPNKQNNLPSVQPFLTNSSNSKPLIDLTNHRCLGKSSIFSDCKTFSFRLNSGNESFKEENKEKISVDETSSSLADLMKSRLSSAVSLSPLQSRENFSLAELCKVTREDTSSQGTINVESASKNINAHIKESGHSFLKIPLDNQKMNSCPRELSMDSDDENDLTISNSCSKKDCQPMSLGELFSRVSDERIDFNSDATSKLEDLWQGPSSKHVTEQPQQQQSKDLDKNLENTSEIKFLLSSFLEVSSEYQNIKTIYEGPASLFGTVVSYHPQTEKHTETMPSKRKNRYQKFSYKTQMCGMNFNRETKLAPIVPFDFSTPSPDDIVKKHQSQAFCHKNIEPLRD